MKITNKKNLKYSWIDAILYTQYDVPINIPNWIYLLQRVIIDNDHTNIRIWIAEKEADNIYSHFENMSSSALNDYVSTYSKCT